MADAASSGDDLAARLWLTQLHRPVGKETGKTEYIERFNITLRQRCSRLVRKALSFSKSVANHSGALCFFIHDYNRRRQAVLNLNTTSA